MTMQIFKKEVYEEGEIINYYKHLEWDSTTYIQLLHTKNKGRNVMAHRNRLRHSSALLLPLLPVGYVALMMPFR